MGEQPLETLDAAVGRAVTVRLKSGDEHEGELRGYDQHMNVVLADPETEDTTIIRGDNVVSILT
ncbi:Like-Sm ribonucleoprotein core [Halobacteriales archaeon SW_7_68_16]|nr:MAG: Like-Sm ribonucleoprotein core [Halobacteriales archaeon SW_7_68_16]